MTTVLSNFHLPPSFIHRTNTLDGDNRRINVRLKQIKQGDIVIKSLAFDQFCHGLNSVHDNRWDVVEAFDFPMVPHLFFRGGGGGAWWCSGNTSEIRVRNPASPQVGKLVVACHWRAVYSTKP